MTRTRSNSNVKITVGGSKVRVPSKVTATPPKKPGRKSYPEHANTNHPNALPPDPWDLSDRGDLDRDTFRRITTTFEGKRFYKDELSEEYVEAKMAEYRRGGVPKLITYALPEQVDDAYASLLGHQINHPKLWPPPTNQPTYKWNDLVNTSAQVRVLMGTDNEDHGVFNEYRQKGKKREP